MSHEIISAMPLNTDYESYTFNGWTNKNKTVFYGLDDELYIGLNANYLELYVSYEEPEYTY